MAEACTVNRREDGDMMPSAPFPDGASIDGEGVWVQILKRPQGTRAALFLDRDGVLVDEVRFLHRARDARLIPGAARVVAQANASAVPVVLVTNQAGIAYGHYGWHAFIRVQEKILADLAADGAFVDGVFACPHHAKGRPPYDHPDHPARKPNPGMLLRAAEMLRLDLAASWMVGDRADDLKAARNAGLAGGVHVLTGHGARAGEREAAMALSGDGFQALAAPSIADAPRLVPLLKG